MSRQAFDQWICNSCDAGTNTPVGNPPSGWIFVRYGAVGTVDERIPDRDSLGVLHYCHECACSVLQVLGVRKAT